MKVGDKVTFKGYENLEEGQAPIFEAGQTLVIAEVIDAGDGIYKAHVDGDTSKADTVFGTETTPIAAAPRRTRTPVAAAPAAPAAGAAPAAAPAAAKAAKPKLSDEEKAAAKKIKEDAAAAKKAEREAAKAEAQRKKEEAERPPEITDTKTLQGLLKKGNPLAVAKTLLTQAEEAYFSLGGVLSHIYYEKIYTTIKNAEGKPKYEAGRAGFEAYVMDELGIAYRKAMYLVNIYMHFTQLGVDEKSLTAIGWSKAKEIVAVSAERMEKDREGALRIAEELIEFAKTKSRDELIAHIRENYVSANAGSDGRRAPAGQQAKQVKFTFSLFEDKAETVKKILAAVGKEIDSDNLSEQMDYVFTQYASLAGLDTSGAAAGEAAGEAEGEGEAAATE